MKKWNQQFNVGKAKHVINYHDGIKKHNDNSRFFDIAIFKSKKKMKNFIKELKADGYTYQF